MIRKTEMRSASRNCIFTTRVEFETADVVEKKVTTERRVLDLSPHAGSDSIQPFFKIYPLVDEHTHTRGVKTNLRMKSLSTFPPFME